MTVLQKNRRGFTLIELMVSMVGALFITVSTFMLVRDATRFFQNQARVSESMLATVTGFERLRADIARAGYLSSPNLARDINRCPRPVSGGDAVLPQQVGTQLSSFPGIQDMGLAQIITDSDRASPVLDGNPQMALNGLDPDTITLWGNYTTAELFPVRSINLSSNSIFLEPASAAIVRSGATTTAVLATIFRANQIIRVLDETNREQYGIIAAAAWTGGLPVITLAATVNLISKETNARCGIRGAGAGLAVNPVDIIQYELANLSADINFEDLYVGESAAYDAGRLDLVRRTLDTNYAILSSEIVAEYASDLKFGLTVTSNVLTGISTYLGEDDAAIANYASVPHEAPANQLGAFGPHLIRGIHARLVVRNRQADREVGIVSGGLPDQLYRIQVASGQFARVRTLRSHIATRNTGNALWQ